MFKGSYVAIVTPFKNGKLDEEIFRKLMVHIRNFLEQQLLGKVLGSRFPIKLVDGKRVEPDLLFLSNETIANGSLTNTVFEGEPTWIIEIVSPSYRDHDTITKREQYRLLNVKEYWIIDPELQVVEIVNFANSQEIRKEIISKGKITPRIHGFEHFTIEIASLFS